MTYLIFAILIILVGLIAAWYLVRSISKDLRSMESEEDKGARKDIEIWRSGK